MIIDCIDEPHSGGHAEESAATDDGTGAFVVASEAVEMLATLSIATAANATAVVRLLPRCTVLRT